MTETTTAPAFKSVSDGTPAGTRVFYDGTDVTHAVRSVAWEGDYTGSSMATLVVVAAGVELVSGDVVWVGLDHIPTEALEAELGSRDQGGAS